MRPIISYIKNPRTSLAAIAERLSFLFPSDILYLKILFYLRVGRKLNLQQPKSFCEKIQWLKLFNRNPNYIDLVDKCQVKEIVSNRIGDKYIIKTLGVWDSFSEIDFDQLPNQFVLKTTHDGGGAGVVICKDKSVFNVSDAQKRINRSMNRSSYLVSREWPYKGVKKRIIAEEYLQTAEDDLADYKFYCFSGCALYCQVIRGRNTVETIDFFDRNWIHQEFYGLNPFVSQSNHIIERPQNYSQMLQIADILSQNLPFARIDLYNIEGVIYFGEITLYPASGLGVWTPQEWDYKLGELINLRG